MGEALGRMIKGAVNAGLFKGFKVARNSPAISHLQFADDTLSFCRDDKDQIRNVQATLICFKAMSGLKVNFSKRANQDTYGVSFKCICKRTQE